MLALVPETAASRAHRYRYAPGDRQPSEPTGAWPLLSRSVPVDIPALADDQVECCLSLDTHLIRNPGASFLVRVRGDGLEQAGLHDGDLLVVDRAVPPLAGSLVVAVVDGKFALRRLSRDAKGRLMLEPSGLNPTPSGHLSVQDFEIWGVARWVVHRLWPNRDQSPRDARPCGSLSTFSPTAR